MGRKNMTLILALRGKDHVVVAGDTLGHTTDTGGMYRFACKKLFPVNSGKWIIGVAGGSAAIGLVELIEHHQPTSSVPALRFAETFSSEVHSRCQKANCDENMWFLFAGVEGTRPFIYSWSFIGEGRMQSPSMRWPTDEGELHEAIGTSKHGALYFASEHHSKDMS